VQLACSPHLLCTCSAPALQPPVARAQAFASCHRIAGRGHRAGRERAVDAGRTLEQRVEFDLCYRMSCVYGTNFRALAHMLVLSWAAANLFHYIYIYIYLPQSGK